MDAIQMTMQDIYYRIPQEVLYAAFNPQANGMSLDECIRRKLIQDKVLADINLVGGAKTQIVLRAENAVPCPTPVPYTIVSGWYSVYQIPPADREYRNIVSVVSLKYPYAYNAYNSIPSPLVNGNYGATLGDLASAALNAQTFANVSTAPTPVVLQGDMIQLNPPQTCHIDWLLECRLEWDRNLTSMDPSALKAFIDLVYTAIRGYIYTNLIFQASRVYLSGGQELNVMKEFIEEGKDYLDRYAEKLLAFQGATIIGRKEIDRILPFMV